MKQKFLITTLASMAVSLAVAQEPAETTAANSPVPTAESVKTDTAGTMKLSLKDAQNYAIEHNYTMQNASLDVQKAEAAKWQSLSTMLPQISASVDYTNMLGYKMNFQGMQIAMNPYLTLGAQVAVAFSGAQVIGWQISKMSVEMSEISKKKSEQDIRDQVKSLYYSALVMEETVALLDKNLENMNKLLESTQNAVKVGVSEQIDADKLQVQVLTMQTTISSTKRSLEMIYNAMRLQLGSDVNTKIELSQTIDDLLNIEVATKLLTEDFDINKNYDYQLLEQTTDIYKKQVTLAKWNFAPSLTVHYSYTKKKYIGDA
ncbi:MAG: TolC family protein, partial [Salinivirgaceae bacterium]|nr:TolC family protein [Salinivirgaceae bacterium]